MQEQDTISIAPKCFTSIAPSNLFSCAADPALYRIARTVFGSLGWAAAAAKGANPLKDGTAVWLTRALPAAALPSCRNEFANILPVSYKILMHRDKLDSRASKR